MERFEPPVADQRVADQRVAGVARAEPWPGAASAAPPVTPRPARRWPRLHWSFLALVVVPGLIAALYLLVIAADQYESEAVFVVRGIEPARAQSSLTELLGAAGGVGATENRSVAEYLLSHDAVAEVSRRGVDLVAMFRRPEADWVSRLWFATPRAETLLRYYRGQVHLTHDPDAGMTRLTVRAFRRDDAERLARLLLKLGEARVNSFNDRALAAVTAAADREVGGAEAELTAIQRTLTAFRTSRRDIDPRRNAAGGQELVGTLEGQLAAARAEADSMGRLLSPGSPQLQAMAARVAGLSREAAAQKARLAGRGQTLAPRLADYEELTLRQEFAAKRYDAARGAREAARAQALRQQLFVVPVVAPNRPDKALYPQRWLTLAAVIAGLAVCWGIGWLLVAGFREHAD